MQQVQGIIVKRTDFRENDAIVRVFSDSCGLIKVMAKGKRWQRQTSLLTLVECVLEKGKNDWYYLKDIHMIDSYLDLRSNYDKLRCAGKIAKLLLQTQQSDQPAPQLFLLTKSYFNRLKAFQNPYLIYYSFVLKLLLHEGLYSPEDCDLPFPVSSEEEEAILRLSMAKSFSVIETLSLPEDLPEKLEKLAELRVN